MEPLTASAANGASRAADLRHVLFVDDDERVTDALREALRPYRRLWEMRFATTAQEALELAQRERCDAIVCDLELPPIDGIGLLERIRQECPTAVRITLVASTHPGALAYAASASHRLVPKPVDAGELAHVIERSCMLQETLTRVSISRRTVGVSSLPPVPRLYVQLTELMRSGVAGGDEVAELVERDTAIAAKVLQLANSAYFGRRTSVTRISQAVVFLGLDTIRALVLQASALTAFRVDPPIRGFDVESLQRHATRVARLSSALLAEAGQAEDAFVTGLLHDVGLLVLAAQEPDELACALAKARLEHRPLHHVERELHGITHAEVGAYLLSLWGLPHSVTDAVAHHHDSPTPGMPFDTVVATYMANLLIQELEESHCVGGLPASELEVEYLTGAGLAARLPGWRELAARQFGDAETED